MPQKPSVHHDRHLGHGVLDVWIGEPQSQDGSTWLRPQIDSWCFGVHALAKAAVQYPQTAYAGLCKSLQSEWLYLQRVLPNCGEAFAPLESAIREQFLPALLGEKHAIGDELRLITQLGVKAAGLGILNPVTTAVDNYTSSHSITEPASDSLLSSAPFGNVSGFIEAVSRDQETKR